MPPVIGKRLAFSLALASCLGVASLALADSTCNVVTDGLDLSHANNGRSAYLGRTIGQTFYAADTILTAVTVWRYPEPDTNRAPMHLYITGTDSANADAPKPLDVLMDGPTLVVPWVWPDPVAVRFPIMPPLQLPRKGLYAFILGVDGPNSCIAGFGIEVDSTNGYAPGSLYRLYPSLGCVGPGHAPGTYAGYDAIFQIEYCEPVDAILPSSWGRVKAGYR